MCQSTITTSGVRHCHGSKMLLRSRLLFNPAIRWRNVISSVGCIRSSEEVSVMEMERRDTVIQLEYL